MTLYKKGVLIFLVAGLVSSVVYAGPIPPENPNVQLEPAPLYDDNNAYCLATFEDRDDSSGGELRFNWSVSGTQVKLEPFSGLANNTQKNSTLSKSFYSEGDEVLCNVTSTEFIKAGSLSTPTVLLKKAASGPGKPFKAST